MKMKILTPLQAPGDRSHKLSSEEVGNIRYWHKADISRLRSNVR
jgi:hypothetical protein